MKTNSIKKIITLAVAVAMMATLVGCGKSNKEESYRAVTVADFNGSVVVSNAGAEAKDVYKDQRLVAQDVATVGNESGMSLVVDDDKALTVEANSEISVNAVGDKTNGKVTVNLVYGSVYTAISNKLQENDSFEVETKNAVMAVRGTEFNVDYNAKTEITTIFVQKGSVEVTAKKSGEKLLLEEGQVALVTADELKLDDGSEKVDSATYSPLKSETWKSYIDDIVNSKKSSGVKEINISSVEDYDDYKKSGDCNDAILYFESKTYNFTDAYYGIFSASDLNNVTFVGTGETNIIVTTGDDLILNMIGSNDVTFYGMTFGHEISEGSECSMGVISTAGCNNIEFIACDIFGCGTVGADIEESSNVKFTGSVIRDCSWSALYMYGSDTTMSDCVISGNCYNGDDLDGASALFIASTYDAPPSNLILENCIIRDNLNSYLKFNSEEGFDITEIECTHLNNKFD